MNKSDHRLKTIQTQSHHHPAPSQKKTKKQSSRKISLKQSALNDHRHIFSKKTHHLSSDNQHKYKIIKELENMTRPQDEHRKDQKYFNLSKNNKSLIFSEHKLSNPQQSNTLKPSKLFPSESKGNSTIKQKQSQTYKKSQKGSTAKKHSKSVYNYTQVEDYPETKMSRGKKTHTKQSHTNISRQSHNRSALTQQGHHVSTSSITKRASKSKEMLQRLLNSAEIKKKTSHFKILSSCLRSYVKEEMEVEKKVDVGQIIKLVRAFNRVEIARMSKPLEELIAEMIGLIEETVEKEGGVERREEKSYVTPQKVWKEVREGGRGKPKSFEMGGGESPSDISKTKKIAPEEYGELLDQIADDEQYQTSLSKDVSRMQQGLQQLMSESKQLRRLIEQSSGKKGRQEEEADKRAEIQKLRMILERQKLVLERIEDRESGDSEERVEEE